MSVVARRQRVEVDPGVLDRLDRLDPILQPRLGRAVVAPRSSRPGQPHGLHRPPSPVASGHSRYSSIPTSVPTAATENACRSPIPFGARATLGPGLPDYYRLDVARRPASTSARAPVTLKILLENVLRHAGGGIVRTEDVETLAAWRPGVAAEAEVPFMPARVVLQDFTGVPAVVDLAVMRDAMADLGGDPAKVNPLVPADLVIDHSVQVDRFGTPGAFAFNVEREYERNGERYQLLRWAQTAFRDLRVVPPGTGIVHQVNLEYLATVVTDVEDPTDPAGSPIPTRSSGPTPTRR